MPGYCYLGISGREGFLIREGKNGDKTKEGQVGEFKELKIGPGVIGLTDFLRLGILRSKEAPHRDGQTRALTCKFANTYTNYIA